MRNGLIEKVICMTEKRFHKAYCCGDTGVVDKVKNEWFIENINSISDIEKNWDNVIDKLNQVAEENEQLKQELYHIDKLIEDLGHEEMKRQYEEICGDVE